MKKILAMMLTAAMMLSMGTAAMAADEGEDEKLVSVAVTEALTLNKVYTVTGSTDETLYPSETLEFTVVPGDNNPDTEEITVDDLVVTGNSDQVIKINLPVYDTVGVYEYTITEDDGDKQAVGYTNDEIKVTVLVTYNYTAKKLDTQIVLSTSTENGKLDTFTNTYEVGHLTVQKTISGNLASDEVYFEMDVTFNSALEVASDITVSGGTNTANPTTIAATEWSAVTEGNGYTVTKTIYLKANETLTFNNIPDGVTYTVVEDAKHGVGTDGFDANSAADTDYTVTYTNENGEIETAGTKAVVVNNEKKTNVETGISVDSIPYIAMLGVVAVGGAGFMVSKKRRSED